MAGGVVTNEGRKIMLDRTYNAAPTRAEVTKFKIGVGTTTPVVTDTDLEHAIPISGTESVDSCDTANWTDSADMTTALNTDTFKEGTSSLNLTKDAGASATAYTYKTTTSRDFTSKELSLWIYIKDATAYAKLATTDCLVIRFGSDSSNYYEWKKDKADLNSGAWTLIDGLTSANADSTTGSPVIASSDYTYVGLTADASATVWSAGDFAMDDIKLISSGDYIKSFETSYPTLDYTALEATIRTRLSTLEANGYAVTEIGIFNEDGTPLMESRDIFTAVSKSSDDELIFITRTILE